MKRLSENYLSSLPLRIRIKHLGRLPFEEIVTILKHADAFVMPNIKVDGDMEGFGLVCLEACLCGATVYASDIDGIPDAIHQGKNGFLLPGRRCKGMEYHIKC
jgi:glycosyltransferase involved in cell wall biosynthesis